MPLAEGPSETSARASASCWRCIIAARVCVRVLLCAWGFGLCRVVLVHVFVGGGGGLPTVFLSLEKELSDSLCIPVIMDRLLLSGWLILNRGEGWRRLGGGGGTHWSGGGGGGVDPPP